MYTKFKFQKYFSFLSKKCTVISENEELSEANSKDKSNLPKPFKKTLFFRMIKVWFYEQKSMHQGEKVGGRIKYRDEKEHVICNRVTSRRRWGTLLFSLFLVFCPLSLCLSLPSPFRDSSFFFSFFLSWHPWLRQTTRRNEVAISIGNLWLRPTWRQLLSPRYKY